MSTYGICMDGNESAFSDALERAMTYAAARNERFTFVEIGMATAATTRGIVSHMRDRWCGATFDLPDGWSLHLAEAQQNLGAACGKVVSAGQDISLDDARVTVVLESAADVLASRRWTAPIHFAFIDGCHGAPCVTRDFLAIATHAAPHAYVVFHDSTPSCQGVHMQPHCQTPIDVRRALQDLGLLNQTRQNWTLVQETTAPHGITIIKQVPTT